MRPVTLILAGASLLTACANWPGGGSGNANLEAEIAAGQGEEVDRVCFTRDIDGWRALGGDAILIEKGVNEWYKLDLIGTCEPDWAFNAIAIRTRPAAALCLTQGDSIVTFDTPLDGRCVISSIHEWDEQARVAHVSDD